MHRPPRAHPGSARRLRRRARRHATTLLDPELTVLDLFDEHASRGPERTALRWRTDAGWRTLAWGAYHESCTALAAGLADTGIGVGDHVAVLSSNRVEWHQADLATLMAGAVTVPVYATGSPAQVEYVLAHAGARLCFVEDAEQLGKVLRSRDQLPLLAHVVVFDGVRGGRGWDADVMGFADLLERGRRLLRTDPTEVLDRRRKLRPHDVATIVYTSSTTGPPKGAVITHANVMATIRGVNALVPIRSDDRFLSFLPLSHIAERMISQFGQIAGGGETWFARRLSTVPEDLRACRPTVFFAVPRVWEKLQEAVVAQIAELRGPTRRLVDAYVLYGAGQLAAEQPGTERSAPSRVGHGILDRTVGQRIRRGLGLGCTRIVASGGGPIHPDLVRWFHGLGLLVVDVYGQTESCGPTTLSPPGAARIGTVGPPLPGVAIRRGLDGELLVRGPNVCAGYHDDEVASRALFDGDGWMRSGDLGEVDADGYVRIVGRKKDLIVTAYGKNVAPQDVERDLCSSPLVAQAVVVGEGRPYLVALLTLDSTGARRWAEANGKPAEPGRLEVDPDLHRAIDGHVRSIGASRSRPERVRRWRLLPRELTIADDELTPTLKVRRAVVVDRYAALIDQMYGVGP